MGEKNKKFYNDCYDPCILGWAMHQECYRNDYGKFNGRIHTHELVVVKAEFEGHKCISGIFRGKSSRSFKISSYGC